MEINITPPVKNAAKLMGGPKVMAAVCGVSVVAVYKWLKKGRLPRTEWTGETNYAAAIVEALDGRVTREDLLQRPGTQAPAEVVS